MIIGITGYIGSGKTEAAKLFQKHGVLRIDPDTIVHKIYESGGEGARKIRTLFGEEYLKKDGSVNRKKLARTVFGNPHKLKILEKLIHPPVLREIKKTLEKKRTQKLTVLEIPAIKNNEMYEYVDKLILIRRTKLPNQNISALEFQSLPETYDYVINNDGDLKDLEKEILKILPTPLKYEFRNSHRPRNPRANFHKNENVLPLR